MNQREHLLQKLSEEANEVAQAISKALIFGLGDKNVLNPTGPDNLTRLEAELVDLQATLGLLRKLQIMPYPQFDGGAQEQAKRLKISQFMAYAAQLGTLDKFPTLDGRAPICMVCADGRRRKATATLTGAIMWGCENCGNMDPVEEIPTLAE